MVTEILVWALVLSKQPNKLVEIYSTETACRQDAREARKTVPEILVTCIPHRSTERPRL
jgi:hypothetical protein